MKRIIMSVSVTSVCESVWGVDIYACEQTSTVWVCTHVSMNESEADVCRSEKHAHKTTVDTMAITVPLVSHSLS